MRIIWSFFCSSICSRFLLSCRIEVGADCGAADVADAETGAETGTEAGAEADSKVGETVRLG